MHTQAVEDYLKAIYKIQDERGKVATTALAERLGVAPASVTGMLKKLAEQRLVEYEPYQGVALTRDGQKLALEVIRHHRLLELYLATALGVPWDRVDAEADNWEHVLSEDVEQRMDALLGFPKTDPHGAPIPSREGKISREARVPLTDLLAGAMAVVAEVNDDDPALLRYVGELGLYPGTPLTVVEVAPFDGPYTLRVEGAEHTLGRNVACQIQVVRVRPPRKAGRGANSAATEPSPARKR